MTPQAVLAMCRERDIKAVDMRFMDFPGIWQHFTIPVSKLEEETFEEGLGFDGSSIRGWQAINESDMLLLPQADTAFVDPFTVIPTLCIICNVQDPITREDYTRDPRNVATTQISLSDRATVRHDADDPEEPFRHEFYFRPAVWRAERRSSWRLDPDSTIDERSDGVVRKIGEKQIVLQRIRLVEVDERSSSRVEMAPIAVVPIVLEHRHVACDRRILLCQP